MIHECNYCNYQSHYKGNLKTHMKNKHQQNINEMENKRAPVTMSVGENGGCGPHQQQCM